MKKIENIVIDSNFSLLQGRPLKDQVKIAIIRSSSLQNIYLSSLLFCMVLANKHIRRQKHLLFDEILVTRALVAFQFGKTLHSISYFLTVRMIVLKTDLIRI